MNYMESAQYQVFTENIIPRSAVFLTSESAIHPSSFPRSGASRICNRADEGLLLTPEAAESVRTQAAAEGHPVQRLDDASLGRLEEDVKDLGIMLRIASPLDVTKPGRLRDLLRKCTERWPRHRWAAATPPNWTSV